MKKGRKTNLYRRINKMLKSENEEDNALGKEILLSNYETLHPDEWKSLNTLNDGRYRYRWAVESRIDSEEIQKYLYDKRQEEIRTNKGRDTEKSESL